MPHLKRGRLAVLSDMGQVEFVNRQPDTFDHLAARFFYHGTVDASWFTPTEIGFRPPQSLGEQADFLFPDGDQGAREAAPWAPIGRIRVNLLNFHLDVPGSG